MNARNPSTPGAAAHAWLMSLPEVQEKSDSVTLMLAVNDRCETIQARSMQRGQLETAQYMTEPLQGFIASLRESLHECGWPFQMVVAAHGRESWITGKRIQHIAIAAAVPRTTFRDDGSWRWDRSGSITAVDDAVRASHLIGGILKPSNQPIRAWSSGSNMMGSAHVHHDAIHARTEAEFLLKKIWMNEGIQGIEKIIEDGRLEPKDWLARMWFVCSELEDLDVNPLGRQARGDEAVEEINEMLDFSDRNSPHFG